MKILCLSTICFRKDYCLMDSRMCGSALPQPTFTSSSINASLVTGLLYLPLRIENPLSALSTLCDGKIIELAAYTLLPLTLIRTVK